MAVVLETQMLAAASSLRFSTKLGGSKFITCHCRDEENDEEDSTMQRNYANLLQFFELTLMPTLLHEFLDLLITDQLSRPTCHPGRYARDYYHQSLAVDQSAASFPCEDDDQCCRHQYAKFQVSSPKRVQLPSTITCPDGGHRCLYIPSPICPNSRAGKFEDRDSSDDDIFKHTTIIKSAVTAPKACPDQCDVHKLEVPCEKYPKFYTKKVNITGSREKRNRLPAAITSSDAGRHRCPYIPGRHSSYAGKSHEVFRDCSSTDHTLNNANIICEVEAPHVCKEFPCKECHCVRCNPSEQLREESGSITSQASTNWPDGGRHRCTYFPCPICHPSR